jgi:Uma2 family endonuclease
VQQPKASMTVDDFLAWAEGRTERYELVDGQLHAMSPERMVHTETKGAIFSALQDAVRRAKLPCRVLGDGATVRIDPRTAYEPDALVRCGPRLPPDTIETPDPLIVVEVLSPGTRNYDAGAKLAGYFTVPSVRHYLMVDSDRRVLIHHRRDGEDIIRRILGASGPLRLDPPGLNLRIEDLFGPADDISSPA